MIRTAIISQSPLIVAHTLQGSISETESKSGVKEALALIDEETATNAKIGMLINVSQYQFETLEARRIWSLEFKMNEELQKRIQFVAIVGSPYEAINTEKRWMETTHLKFFEDEPTAINWLMEMQ